MNHAAYHVVYVDARISADLDGKHLQKPTIEHKERLEDPHELTWDERNADCLKAIIHEVQEVRSNLKRLLRQFNSGTCKPLVNLSALLLCDTFMISLFKLK